MNEFYKKIKIKHHITSPNIKGISYTVFTLLTNPIHTFKRSSKPIKKKKRQRIQEEEIQEIF